MSFRPPHTICPPARFTDDMGGLVSIHRHPVAPALRALTPSQSGPTTTTSTSAPSPLLDPVDQTLVPTSRLSGLAPPRGAGKRLAHNTDHSASDDNLNDDTPIGPILKKAKTIRPSDTLDDLGMHTNVQVMDINDASDPREEALNKTDPTANIKFSFTSAPPAPGQTKV
jgi:hypothetical protein